MLPTAAGSILLKKCESEGALEHQKYEKLLLQLGCLMQTGIDGYEIYKNVGVMHAVIFADGALGAKNAPHCSQKQYFEGGMERKIANRTSKGATRANRSGKNGSYQGRLGVRKVIC